MRNELDQLCLLPLHRQLELFRQKQLSPIEILNAQIAHIEASGDAINAFTYKHFDDALAAVRESETRYQHGNPRLLEGVTVAVKDEYSKAGWIVTEGCRVYKDSVKQGNTRLSTS